MQPVIADMAPGPWSQLEEERAAEWRILAAVAASGERTSGPGLEAEASLVARLGVPLRVVRSSAKERP